MDGYITLSNTEMQDLVRFCSKKKKNFQQLLPALIKQNRFKINVTDNPTVFWIPHKDGSTGIALNEFRRFREKQ